MPMLLLDSYRCHMMTSVVAKINALGVAVEHIPGGCTGLLQPVDVGIGRPLKCRVKQRWSDWMIEKEATNAFKPPGASFEMDY